MKYKLNFGFSIAELMISLLIVMVVGTAMAPIVGPKKTKTPKLRMNHGVYECFYDGNQLKYFYSNGTTQQSGSVNDGYCTFSAPNANFYYVEVIGAGGKGAGTPSNTYHIITKTTKMTGGISTLSDFASSYASAPEYIREIFDKMSNRNVKYTILSQNDGPASGCIQSTGGNHGYINQYPFPGARGGDGIKAIITASLDSSSKVEINDLTATKGIRISTKNKEYGVDVVNAGRGRNSVGGNILPVEEEANFCRSGSSYSLKKGSDAKCTNIKNATCVKDGSGSDATRVGSISAEPSSFPYETQKVVAKFYYGTNGENGFHSKKIYTDFKGKTLRLQPAASNKVQNQNQLTFSRLYSVEGDGSLKELLNARSGENGTTKQYPEDNTKMDLEQDMEIFPSTLWDSVISPKTDGSVSYSALKLTTGMADISAGSGGSGAYSLLVNLSYPITYKMNGQSKTIIYPINKDKEATCYDAFDKPDVGKNTRGQYFCKAGNGVGGAIVISW